MLPHVFSTYVEMIPLSLTLYSLVMGVLHVCGDDPLLNDIPDSFEECSPRMWR